MGRRIWPFDAFRCTSLGNDDIKLAVKEAAEKVAKAGYEHADLHWRHVGLYRSKGKLHSLFFDLAAMREANTSSVSAMLAKLNIM